MLLNSYYLVHVQLIKLMFLDLCSLIYFPDWTFIFIAQSTDIASLNAGLNRVTVAVNNTLSPFTIPPGHWETREGSYYPGGHYREFAYQMDFFNYAGIHRSVTLAAVPAKCSIIDIAIITQDIQVREFGIL